MASQRTVTRLGAEDLLKKDRRRNVCFFLYGTQSDQTQVSERNRLGKSRRAITLLPLLTFLRYVVPSYSYLHHGMNLVARPTQLASGSQWDRCPKSPSVVRPRGFNFCTGMQPEYLGREGQGLRMVPRTKSSSTFVSNGDSKTMTRGRTASLLKQKKETPTEQSKSFVSSITQNTTTLEMTMMSAVGFGISTAVVLSLASSEVDPTLRTDILKDLSGPNTNALVADGLEIVEEGVEELEVISRSILSAAMPQSATDVLAVALGEGMAGVLGAVATWTVGTLLRLRTEANAAAAAASAAMIKALDRGKSDKPFIVPPFAKESGPTAGSKNQLISEAVADGDYFLTRAAAIPLLEAVGIPPFTATLASVLIATIPYELIKISTRQRRLREEEDKLFDELLRERQMKERRARPFQSWFKPESAANSSALVELKSETKPFKRMGSGEEEWVALSSSKSSVDTVELFTDITKWLEYDVLTNDFSGRLLFNGNLLNPALESALFGFLAVLSTQLYADIIYRYSDLGQEEARNESRTRSLDAWASLYSTKCLSGAALFGVYESVRLPISQLIQRLLAGGFDSCLGSRDMDLCMETYMIDNPPGASFEARSRAFFAALVSLSNRFGTEINDDAGFQELGRSLFVHIYSAAGSFLRLFESM